MTSLPHRSGPRPATTPTNPHTQLDQQPVDTLQRDLFAAELFELPGVEGRDSLVSVPGARALWSIEPDGAPHDAFFVGAEFAHLHPGADQSLHVMLPPDLVADAITAGWAEEHPVARRGEIPGNAVMLSAPRDDTEREVVAKLVKAPLRDGPPRTRRARPTPAKEHHPRHDAWLCQSRRPRQRARAAPCSRPTDRHLDHSSPGETIGSALSWWPLDGS